MLITTYKVTSPNVIEEFVEEVTTSENQTLVKVDTLAICKADIRYFLGLRSKSVLEHKYPLTPIHEAVGYVVKDYTGDFKAGDKVILVPNSINKKDCKTCKNDRCALKELGENYCPRAGFCSSNKDGFLKPFYVANKNALVKIDNSIPSEIAVWSELLSVGVAGARRINMQNRARVALFGDGIMAYIVYLILVHMYNADVTIFGVDENKMKMFEKAKTTTFAAYNGENFDILIECVGGRFSQDAINQMIDIANIGADLLLMGVNEDLTSINTRKVLEKGLALKGVTRSAYTDFVTVSKLIEDKELQKDLSKMIISIMKIESINEIYKAFQKDIENKTIIGKNLLRF